MFVGAVSGQIQLSAAPRAGQSRTAWSPPHDAWFRQDGLGGGPSEHRRCKRRALAVHRRWPEAEHHQRGVMFGHWRGRLLRHIVSIVLLRHIVSIVLGQVPRGLLKTFPGADGAAIIVLTSHISLGAARASACNAAHALAGHRPGTSPDRSANLLLGPPVSYPDRGYAGKRRPVEIKITYNGSSPAGGHSMIGVNAKNDACAATNYHPFGSLRPLTEWR